MSAEFTPEQFGSPQPAVLPNLRMRAVLPAAILAVTFLSYAAALGLGFVFDDHVLILTNGAICSWSFFPGYFTSHIWSFQYPHLLANYYRPLFLVWLRLNDVLFGFHPWGWHLTSVLAHVAVTGLVYRLGLRLAGDRWTAGAAALIFGLHPVHVEAVAYVAAAQEPLVTLCALGAVLAFCRSREDRGGLWWLAALVLAGAAVLCKESGMMLPILVAGYAWIYGPAGGRESSPDGGRARSWRVRGLTALEASIPFWLVVLAYVPLRVRALKGFAHVITPVTLSQEVLTLPSVLLSYLRLLLWPSRLSCYYDTPYISSPGWRDFLLPAVLLAAGVAAVAFWYAHVRRRAPDEARAMAFAGLWLVVTLLPVLNFRFLPRSEIVHDRYLYLPSVGAAILAAVALRQAIRWEEGHFLRLAGVVAVALLLGGAMAFATVRQSLFWSDDLSLNYRAHQIAPRNVSATTSLAAAVAQRGMNGAAVELYQQALALRPDFWQANVNLAYLYYAQGNYPEAVRFFYRAAAANPADGEQFLYLGMALLRMGRLTEAEKAFRTALLVRPQGKFYHLGLGMALRQEGKLAEAKKEIEAELAGDPHNPQARTLLADVTRQMQAQANQIGGKRARKTSSASIK